MGKRAATHRFMPNKFVFPGGKLDRVDQQLNVPGELSDPVMARLRKATRASGGRSQASRLSAGRYQGNL